MNFFDTLIRFSLNVTCENDGCTAIVKLDALAAHLVECEFNPKKLIECQNGCGMLISKESLTVRRRSKCLMQRQIHRLDSQLYSIITN